MRPIVTMVLQRLRRFIVRDYMVLLPHRLSPCRSPRVASRHRLQPWPAWRICHPYGIDQPIGIGLSIRPQHRHGDAATLLAVPPEVLLSHRQVPSRSHSGQCRTPSTLDGCKRSHVCGHLNRNRQLILAFSFQLIALASFVREASFVARNPTAAMQNQNSELSLPPLTSLSLFIRIGR